MGDVGEQPCVQRLNYLADIALQHLNIGARPAAVWLSNLAAKKMLPENHVLDMVLSQHFQ